MVVPGFKEKKKKGKKELSYISGIMTLWEKKTGRECKALSCLNNAHPEGTQNELTEHLPTFLLTA